MVEFRPGGEKTCGGIEQLVGGVEAGLAKLTKHSVDCSQYMLAHLGEALNWRWLPGTKDGPRAGRHTETMAPLDARNTLRTRSKD